MNRGCGRLLTVGVEVWPDQTSERKEEASVDLGMDVSVVVDLAAARLENPARMGRINSDFIFI